MSFNKITLNFNKTISNLTGNAFGKKTYQEQVNGKIDIEEEIDIVFPPHIKNIGSSFVQGFFDAFVEEIGVSGIEKQVKVQADGIVDPQKYVMDKLKF